MLVYQSDRSRSFFFLGSTSPEQWASFKDWVVTPENDNKVYVELEGRASY